MAGTLVIDTLKASSGVLATQNGMSGIAKAWVQFNGSGTISNSFNISSVTKTATGTYLYAFTTAMPSSSYSVVSTSCCNLNWCIPIVFSQTTSATYTAPTSSSFYTWHMNLSGSAVDPTLACTAVFA